MPTLATGAPLINHWARLCSPGQHAKQRHVLVDAEDRQHRSKWTMVDGRPTDASTMIQTRRRRNALVSTVRARTRAESAR
jgi:hypothetical protein